MDVAVLIEAVERALELRGVVMLRTSASEQEWCSIHSAVDGHLEVHVGEPGRRWLRQHGDEGWLRSNGFVQVIDAWARPMGRRCYPAAVAELLAASLVEGLGADPASRLEHVLEFPGVSPTLDVPAPTAPHVDHIAHALRAVASAQYGKVCIGGGSPEETWAWVFTVKAGLLICPEQLDGDSQEADVSDWTITREHDSTEEAARRLAAVLHDSLKRPATAPLFISLMVS